LSNGELTPRDRAGSRLRFVIPTEPIGRIPRRDEDDPVAVLRAIAANVRPGQHVLVGVTNPIDPAIETSEQVRERVLLAAEHVPLEQLGTTDDCGFSPFADDRSTTSETAFAKIRARIEGTRLAAEQLGA
jgi:5-methyltetrahydropteroyltriglutamate--homocysteine methyltransferase